jgi:hypothetical protein
MTMRSLADAIITPPEADDDAAADDEAEAHP